MTLPTLDVTTWWQVGFAGSGFIGAALYYIYFRYRAWQRRAGRKPQNMLLLLNVFVAIPTGRIWLIMPFLPQARRPGLFSPLWGLPWTTQGILGGAIGAAISLGGLFVILRFLRQNLAVTKRDYAAPEQLLTSGIYARTRHPGVVANFFLISGIALATGALITLSLLPIFAVVLHLTCVIEERQVLQPRFQDAYAVYAKGVPRYWSPIAAVGLGALVVGVTLQLMPG